MRVLVIYCHPVESSFNAALHTQVVRSLKLAGHEVDDCDLYAEDFNPVLSREERLGYHEVPANQARQDRSRQANPRLFNRRDHLSHTFKPSSHCRAEKP